MTDNQITSQIINCAIQVHKILGPGLLESTYSACLCYKLKKQGLKVQKEKPIPVFFEGVSLDCGYKIDILVEERIIVELKSVNKISDIHLAQTLSYLRIGDYKLGLLINFNVILLKNGIKRIINNRY